ncbi:hypothetical protein PHJA_001333100 [Phtheirospermum japonicum]|uniref:Wall-associated receptor kinase galacturonan-binding domain-containing protein n=1 Tax=Phtheirospermum japonicum TaxID=374723 RepID=A0A830BWR8_9LAMI|nr:hypothetical protein PHJA_001333100 [Phtheirospermum japonicum]
MLSHKYPLLKSLFSCLIIIHLLLRPCNGKKNYHCPPSSCGNIPNISYPFRLKNDPKNCGNPKYELACENNTTFIYLDSSHKYIVRAIGYPNHTIHLADPSILENDSCSLPEYSVSTDKFRTDYPYSISRHMSRHMSRNNLYGTWQIITSFLTFMSCPYPVNNSLLLEVAAADCGHRNYGFNKSDSKHTYIKYGELNGSYIMDNCTVDLIVLMNPLPLKAEKSVSLSEIHSSLLYGFELSWFEECYVGFRMFRCGKTHLHLDKKIRD